MKYFQFLFSLNSFFVLLCSASAYILWYYVSAEHPFAELKLNWRLETECLVWIIFRFNIFPILCSACINSPASPTPRPADKKPIKNITSIRVTICSRKWCSTMMSCHPSPAAAPCHSTPSGQSKSWWWCWPWWWWCLMKYSLALDDHTPPFSWGLTNTSRIRLNGVFWCAVSVMFAVEHWSPSSSFNSIDILEWSVAITQHIVLKWVNVFVWGWNARFLISFWGKYDSFHGICKQ